MIKIEMTENGLKTTSEGSFVDNGGDLINELNLYLNNGWELVKIEGGAYFVDVDQTQLCQVIFINNDHNYCEVITRSEAYFISLYIGGCVFDENGEEILIDEGLISFIDLRNFSEKEIECKKQMCKKLKTTFDLLEAVEEDLSYA